MTNKYTYENDITFRGSKAKQVFTIFVERGEVTDFTLHIDLDGRIENVTDIDDLGDYLEANQFVNSLKSPDFDYTKNLWRYEGNYTIAGVYHIPTDTFVGVRGIYDSWNGTDYYAKVATKLKTVEVYRPCELEFLPRTNP